MSDQAPAADANHRRLRFGLRTMFVAVMVFACWVGYQVNWIRQRNELLARPDVFHSRFPFVSGNLVIEPPTQSQRAPGVLWILGEKGVHSLQLPVSPERFETLDCAECREEIRHAKSLFPEAVTVEVYPLPSDRSENS
jgi:hypothetical protein